MIAKIIDEIGLPATYEQLAEECCELAHASLKMARVMRGDNPTPKREQVARDEFLEEFADVKCCMDLLITSNDLDNVYGMQMRKLDRWKDRIEKMKKEKNREGKN